MWPVCDGGVSLVPLSLHGRASCLSRSFKDFLFGALNIATSITATLSLPARSLATDNRRHPSARITGSVRLSDRFARHDGKQFGQTMGIS